MVDELAEIEQKLSPPNPIVRSKWMFDTRAFEAFGNIDTPHEEGERLQTEAQSNAIVLGTALFVILSGRYDEACSKWAFGVVGLILGFWLKR